MFLFIIIHYEYKCFDICYNLNIILKIRYLPIKNYITYYEYLIIYKFLILNALFFFLRKL